MIFFKNVGLLVILLVHFGILSMDKAKCEQKKKEYIEHIEKYLREKHLINSPANFSARTRECNLSYEKLLIAHDLRNQVELFQKLGKYIEDVDQFKSAYDGFHSLLSSESKYFDSIQLKLKDSRQGIHAVPQLSTLEGLGVYIQNKHLFEESEKYICDIESEDSIRHLCATLLHVENNEVQLLGKILLGKLHCDMARKLASISYADYVQSCYDLKCEKLKDGKMRAAARADFADDNKAYTSRNQVPCLVFGETCIDLTIEYADEESYVTEKLNPLLNLHQRYEQELPVLGLVYKELRSNLLAEVKKTGLRDVAYLPASFPDFHKNNQKAQVKKVDDSEVATSFLPDFLHGTPKKNTKNLQQKSKSKHGKSRNRSAVGRYESSVGKGVMQDSSFEIHQPEIPQIIPKEQVPKKIPLMNDKSLILGDSGYVISFGYQHNKDVITDKILRIRKNLQGKDEVGKPLCYHARVQAKKDAYMSGHRDEDTVSHTFPEILDCLVGQCIQTTFTDKRNRQINNRVFFGEKLIDGKYQQGLYILGFVCENGKEICYHECFKKRNLDHLKIQQFSAELLLTDEERNSLLKGLEFLEN